MPQRRELTEAEFTAVRDRVIETAPDGLDETTFNALLDRELAAAESTDPAPADIDSESPSLASAATFAGMKTAPAIVALTNKAAKAAVPLLKSVARARVPIVGAKAPGVIAMDAALKLHRGDVSGAAKSTAAAVAVTQAPKIAAAVQRATAPTSGTTASGARWTLKPGMGGSVTRIGGLLSRLAGPVAVGYEAMFGDNAAGHRPYGETAETTAARQEQMARDYKALVNAKQPGAITGETVDEILASIARYRGAR